MYKREVKYLLHLLINFEDTHCTLKQAEEFDKKVSELIKCIENITYGNCK